MKLVDPVAQQRAIRALKSPDVKGQCFWSDCRRTTSETYCPEHAALYKARLLAGIHAARSLRQLAEPEPRQVSMGLDLASPEPSASDL